MIFFLFCLISLFYFNINVQLIFLSFVGFSKLRLVLNPKRQSNHRSDVKGHLTGHLSVFQGEPGADKNSPGAKGESGNPGLPVRETLTP